MKLESITIQEATTEALEAAIKVLRERFCESYWIFTSSEWTHQSKTEARCNINIDLENRTSQHVMILYVKNWKSIEKRT